MATLERMDWYDIARTTNWTPQYVPEDELFPAELSGHMDIPMDKWEIYDEPFKQTFPEYVKVQREKDAGAYSVKAALERSKLYENADPGWLSVLKAHYGAIARGEYAASGAEARMVRFAKAPGQRNMATLGMLDEIRHSQMQLFFPHEYVSKDRQFDWAHKALDTNEWAAIAARSMFDDMMMGRSAVEVGLMLTFAFETGFTNMQFLGLAADAAEAGDWTFSSLISSIQTDESRHAQIGGPLIGVLVANGKKAEAQRMVDSAVWRAWKLFSVLTGPTMDYYTPLEHRKQSFKEFMQEWIVAQFERSLLDLGLDKPWYWDIFMREIEDQHHGMHLGVWYWRQTAWWNPAAGVSTAERQWLEEKYPGWNKTWGACWDVITDNLVEGRKELAYPETLPVVCNMCQLPINTTPGAGWQVRDYPHEHDGRLYHFCSEPCRKIFQDEPQRYAGHQSIVDRFLSGEIQPMNLAGALQYMGLAPGESGDDAHNFKWADTIRDERLKKAS
ncbi:toluene 4-monooxygenase protein A [Solimonas aquatica]|uniref:Toluene 4-monooxygenase protein A n=1 Tax=Solimonas aquatica TaxID=489703 RepID=A0A1H9BHF8_9GAMM|nr:aromatic/alkene/methane monooxygenase hydroxylase/oxygenase subunit alpha [Solimonas aquatica]SEP88432.1 toluene 4-monooxygenase protein A [Solimonas aquatica]